MLQVLKGCFEIAQVCSELLKDEPEFLRLPRICADNVSKFAWVNVLLSPDQCPLFVQAEKRKGEGFRVYMFGRGSKRVRTAPPPLCPLLCTLKVTRIYSFVWLCSSCLVQQVEKGQMYFAENHEL